MAHRPILVHYLPVCIQAKNGFYTFKSKVAFEKSKEAYFMTCGNYTKFKCQSLQSCIRTWPHALVDISPRVAFVTTASPLGTSPLFM